MFSYLKKSIATLYKEEGQLFQGKVLILYYFHLFIIVFSVFALIIYSIFLPQRLVFGLPIFLSGAGLSIINIFLIHKKFYNTAVYLFVTVFATVFIFMQFQKTGGSVHTGYTSYFYLIMGLMILVSFFGDRKLLLILSSVVVFVNLMYFYLAYPHVQDSPQNYESLMSGFVSTMFATLLSGGLLYMLKDLLDKAVEIAQEQTQEANVQYWRMFNLMSTTELFESVEEVSNSLHLSEKRIGVLMEENNNALKDISMRSSQNMKETKEVGSLSKKQVNEFEKINESLITLSQELEVAGSSADDYSAGVRATLESAQTARNYIEETQNFVHKVLESIMHIAEITSTIHGVAEKVNMLALNASIESSRAGEYGRGFSVVAEEIAKLAEQTSLSANNISRFVKEELELIQNTVKLVGKLEVSFNEIFRNIENMDKFIVSIKDIIYEGSNMSFRLEAVVQGLTQNSAQIEKFTFEQAEDEKKIQEELMIIVKGMETMKDAFVRLRNFSQELSLQSTNLKEKIIN